jgi:hypothetical protein
MPARVMHRVERMLVLAWALLVSLTFLPPVHHRHTRKHAVSARAPDRTVRAARVALLALRREMLHDFLVEAGTEHPAFFDARVTHVAAGIDIGPTTVSIDFLGAPIVRARVRNRSDRSTSQLVTVRVRNRHGRIMEASTWVERLEPGGSREIELLCPESLTPMGVEWVVNNL